ncbi:transporter substrate-binding domain-containing protein [Microaceticoccus formicicus]|uniref:transporter substrate-binding domain-containing protein n=1 Tax=Microaceticoccus formicicus TaxID=3118105 RepID=UPI003CD04B6A|nr:transporter substrate-binding domain-containing protein [Peptoniphilaceae bacterium AMB_02]
MIYKFLGESNYPPFDYIEDGKIMGFNADITNAICKVLGLESSIELIDWAKVIKFTKSDFDYIYQGIFWSEGRKKYLEFSDSYLTVSHSFFVDKSCNNSVCFGQLKDMRVGVQKDAVTHDFLEERKETIKIGDLKLYSDHVVILDELFKGNIDAVAGNRMTILYLMNKHFKDKEVMTIGEPIEMSKLCYAVRPYNKQVMELINEGLKIIISTGEYNRIYEKWFGVIISRFDQRFVDYTDTAVIYIDAFGKIIRANKIAAGLFGNIELVGKDVLSSGIDGIIPVAIIRRVMDGYEESILNNVKTRINEQDLYLSYCATPVHDNLGNINGAVLSIRNETKARIADKKLKNYNKLKSLSRIVGGVAHEIKNPLTSIKNYVDLLPKLYDDTKFRESIINNLPQQVELINELIDELLQYTKPQKPYMEVIDCREVVDLTIKLMKFNKKIDILNEIEQNQLVWVDKKNLRQIITNVVLNAVEASKDGDKIIIKTGRSDDEKSFNIEVIDEGSGISLEKIDYVFDPFFTDKDTGTGLGLYICHQLMAENKGSINIDSTENGTKVTLSLLKYMGELNEEIINR